MYKYPIVNNLYVCVHVCCNRKRKSSFLNFSCHIFLSKLQTVLSSSPTLSLLAVTLLLLLETSEPKHSPTPLNSRHPNNLPSFSATPSTVSSTLVSFYHSSSPLSGKLLLSFLLLFFHYFLFSLFILLL